MTDDNGLNFPIIALSESTKSILSCALNPKKVLGTKENKLSRDWRGLAHFCGITGKLMPSVSMKDDPTGHLLNIMYENKKKICHLCKYLEEMDRWDIIDDINENLNKDIEIYKKRIDKDNSDFIENAIANSILTHDDLQKVDEGKELQKYDAFFLYDDDDEKFAEYVRDRLEELYIIRICDRKRDVIIGDLSTMMKIIKDRCNYVIVLISYPFLKSNSYNELMNFSFGLSIESRKRIICPISLYRLEKNELPDFLRCKLILNYSDFHKKEYRATMWQTLAGSVLVHKTKNNNDNIVIGDYENFENDVMISKKYYLDNYAIVKANNSNEKKHVTDAETQSIAKASNSNENGNMFNDNDVIESSKKHNDNNFDKKKKKKKSILQSVVEKCKKKKTKIIDENTEIPSLPSVKNFESPECAEIMEKMRM